MTQNSEKNSLAHMINISKEFLHAAAEGFLCLGFIIQVLSEPSSWILAVHLATRKGNN
jgi:hypothetical protein